MSPSHTFFVTEFADYKTAKQHVYTSDNEKHVAQIYRRAGQWLHTLHSAMEATQQHFTSDWMFEAIDDQLIRFNVMAQKSEYGPMIRQLFKDTRLISKRQDLAVQSHGDFHGGNLLIASGTTIGMDFTEVTHKLAVYDIVDFLKMDVFRRASDDSVNQSGIITAHMTKFFQQYKHPIDHDILDFCLKARLLIDWLLITPDVYEKSHFQRKKFSFLQKRLQIAFSNN